MLAYSKEINFFDKIQKTNQEKKYINIILIILYLIICIIAGFLYIFEIMQKNSYNHLINNYDNMLTKEKLVLIEENKHTLHTLIQKSESYKDLKNIYAEESFFSVSIMENIAYLQPVDIIIHRFSYRNGVIDMNCSSEGLEEGAAFSKRLSDAGYFNEVIYTGVTTVRDENRYMYTIQIHIGDDDSD